MRTTSHLRHVVIGTTVMLGTLTGVSVLPAASASVAAAATVRPLSATGCAGNVCMYIAGNTGGTALFQAWARNTAFTGHFYLSGPSTSVTSPTKTWQGKKANNSYWSTSKNNAKGGQYCIAGYATSGAYEGTACESLKS
jgi:hypothetical protein